jgi:large subunit ribosomal protein L10
MERARKQEFVEGLAGKLAGAQCVYVTDFTGLDVERITLLRSKLRASDVDYVVVKNTLARRAIAGTVAEPLGGLLEGPTAFALGRADVVAAAKVLTDFAKDGDLPRIKGGVVAGRIVSQDEIRRLAALPAREVLLSQMLGSLRSPIQGFVFVLSGLLAKFVRTVDAVRAQKAERQPAAPAEAVGGGAAASAAPVEASSGETEGSAAPVEASTGETQASAPPAVEAPGAGTEGSAPPEATGATDAAKGAAPESAEPGTGSAEAQQ